MTSDEQLLKAIERLTAAVELQHLPNKALLTMEELCGYIGLGETKIRDLVREERIPFVSLKEEGKEKGALRFPVKEIDLWVRSLTVKPKAS